ncbi:unnamed protein product, partial [marine sediment metagenome]
MDIISKNIFNMDISQRGIQRIIYNEIKALEPLKIDLDSNLREQVNNLSEDEV